MIMMMVVCCNIYADVDYCLVRYIKLDYNIMLDIHR